MTDQRAVDRLIAELRAHVTELARLQREGGEPRELTEHRRAISTLQGRLAYAVRELLRTKPQSPQGPDVRVTRRAKASAVRR